jgi:hypothetical protein
VKYRGWPLAIPVMSSRPLRSTGSDDGTRGGLPATNCLNVRTNK